MTRWQQFYKEDERVKSAPATYCARHAAEVFVQRDKRVILDLGCGTGRDSTYLVKQGLFVVGVDLAGAGLGIAKRTRKDEMNWIQADARQLPFRNSSFEGLYCFGLLHEFTGESRENDVRGVMREIHRVLRSLGVLVLTCPQSMYHPQCYCFHAATATWGVSGAGAGPKGNGS